MMDTDLDSLRGWVAERAVEPADEPDWKVLLEESKDDPLIKVLILLLTEDETETQEHP